MIVWLASYPRSGNSLLQIILRGSFEIYPPFSTASGELIGHIDQYLDAQILSKAAVSDHTYLRAERRQIQGRHARG
jgi:hypothetical protein